MRSQWFLFSDERNALCRFIYVVRDVYNIVYMSFAVKQDDVFSYKNEEKMNFVVDISFFCWYSYIHQQKCNEQEKYGVHIFQRAAGGCDAVNRIREIHL